MWKCQYTYSVHQLLQLMLVQPVIWQDLISHTFLRSFSPDHSLVSSFTIVVELSTVIQNHFPSGVETLISLCKPGVVAYQDQGHDVGTLTWDNYTGIAPSLCIANS